MSFGSGWGIPGGTDGKESAQNVTDPGSIAGSERSPGEGYGNALQRFCLENSMDRGTRKSWTQHFHFQFCG